MAIKSIRESFLPDIGDVIIKVDLSQAEDRTGKMYCNDDELVIQANLKPWDFDAHTHNAKMIFEKDDISKEERHLGKCTVHGFWRDMGANRLAESILIQSNGKIVLPFDKAQWMIDQFDKAMPTIRGYYMPWVRRQIDTKGFLENSFGRIFDCEYLIKDPNLYRKAYSFLPQSECADLINLHGVIPITQYMMDRYSKPMSLQKHDEVVVSVPYSDAFEVASFIVSRLETPIEIPTGSNRWLSIPATVEVSNTFYGGVEFAPIPDRDSFYQKLISGGIYE